MLAIGRLFGAALTVTVLVVPACGGGSPPEAADQPASSPEEDDFEAPPLEIQDKCPPEGTAHELWALGASWANEKMKAHDAGEACLVVPAGEAFTVTVHNPKAKGVLNLDHNFATYSDSVALDRIFYSGPVKKGGEKSIDVPPMEAGTYLFRCDYHARLMKGVLVVQ